MTPDTSAFLSGQGIPVALSEVEDTLARLWGPAAEREGGPVPENPTVTRVVLANVVVADLGPGPSRVEGLVDTLARQYPARLILLKSGGPGASGGVRAEVSALCHLPAPGRPQVCSELIVLSAGKADERLLPASVLGLLEADLPMVLLWSGDPRSASGVFDTLADQASRVILDLPGPHAETDALQFALDLKRNPYDRDIAWFGITLWRELVAQFFDAPGCEALLPTLDDVSIQVRTPTPDRLPRVGLWLMGWLAGQLGWTPARHERTGPGSLRAQFQGPAGAVVVTLALSVDPSLALPAVTRVRLKTSSGHRFEVARVAGTGDVRATAESCEHDPLPRTIHAPEWDTARRLSAALESARDDPPYRAALPIVLWAIG